MIARLSFFPFRTIELKWEVTARRSAALTT